MTIRSLTASVICLAAVIVSSAAQATDYQSGYGALQVFDDAAMQSLPPWLKVWLVILLTSFAAGLFFVWNHPIARWVVGGLIATMVVVEGLAPALGIPVVSGFLSLCHLAFWSPGLYLLLRERPFLGKITAFSIWSGIMTAVILFSFVFDIRDALIYLRHLI
ncbi:MAG: hypothetical protein HKN85_08825 [Gammaproteobacteria bacterium]|nr:hypothetical protein [Gammaproteobacteria bacterium]